MLNKASRNPSMVGYFHFIANNKEMVGEEWGKRWGTTCNKQKSLADVQPGTLYLGVEDKQPSDILFCASETSVARKPV